MRKTSMAIVLVLLVGAVFAGSAAPVAAAEGPCDEVPPNLQSKCETVVYFCEDNPDQCNLGYYIEEAIRIVNTLLEYCEDNPRCDTAYWEERIGVVLAAVEELSKYCEGNPRCETAYWEEYIQDRLENLPDPDLGPVHEAVDKVICEHVSETWCS